MIKIDIFREDELIETRVIDLYSWYEGDIGEIDSNEIRAARGITKIKGMQFDEFAKLELSWCNFYDRSGRLDKSEEFKIS